MKWEEIKIKFQPKPNLFKFSNGKGSKKSRKGWNALFIKKTMRVLSLFQKKMTRINTNERQVSTRD
jgi:hypothetical protein